MTVTAPASVADLLRELIRIPSVNPAFAAGRAKGTGEDRVGAYLSALARQAGLRVKSQSAGLRRKNIWVVLPALERRKRRIILAPHLDTIGVEEAGQLQPKRRGGRTYGRGACDAKGSVAAMFFSLLELARSAERPRRTEILFVGLADEENAQLGSRAFAAKCPPADLAIVGEPTRLQVVTAHKGDFWFEIEAQGKAAHGSRPELGKNAVLEMARMIVALETDYAATLRKRRHLLLGSPTINVGVVQGGRQPNVVPDRCRIQVDRRALPGENLAQVEAELLCVAQEANVRATISDLRQRPTPALETDPALPSVRDFLRHMGRKQVCGVDYFCDAAIIAGAGIPCVVYGPGDIAQAHTEKEWISERSLCLGAERLLRYLRSLP